MLLFFSSRGIVHTVIYPLFVFVHLFLRFGEDKESCMTHPRQPLTREEVLESLCLFLSHPAFWFVIFSLSCQLFWRWWLSRTWRSWVTKRQWKKPENFGNRGKSMLCKMQTSYTLRYAYMRTEGSNLTNHENISRRKKRDSYVSSVFSCLVSTVLLGVEAGREWGELGVIDLMIFFPISL